MTSLTTIRHLLDREKRLYIQVAAVIVLIIAIAYLCLMVVTGGETTSYINGRGQLRSEVAKRLGLKENSEVGYSAKVRGYPVMLPIVVQREVTVQCGSSMWKSGTPEADEIIDSLDADDQLNDDVAGPRVEFKLVNSVRTLAGSFLFWFMMLASAIGWVPGFRRMTRAKRSITRSRTICLLCKYEVTKLRRCPECGASPHKRSIALMTTIRGALGRTSRTKRAG